MIKRREQLVDKSVAILYKSAREIGRKSELVNEAL
jgi:hypothetical protein